MGLLDNWASRLTGPGPEHRPTASPPRMRPLTAAGSRINLRSPDLIHTRHPEWQSSAWDYRDEVPELRFAGDFITNALGRLRVYPAENRPRGQEPVPLAADHVPSEVTNSPAITDDTRAACKAAHDRLDLDRHGSSLLARMGENLEFAGECYLLGEMGDEGEQWTIRSVSELVVTQGGARLIEPGHGGGASRELRPEEVELLRLWNPHPRYYDWPDAAIAALLTTLEGMVILGRRGRAHDRSRISSGTALFVPDEFSLTRAGSAEDVDEDDDPFMAELAQAMMAPVRDESDPSTVVPVVIRGPGVLGDKYGADMIKTVQLHSEDPKGLDERYEALVQRFARGISLPPEVVKGVGDTNHWNGAVIDAAMVKNHIEPRAERMVDALTAAYFRPALKAMGVPAEQRNRVCLWFDASELVQNPNREQAAKDAHTAGAISDAALRGELGFTEEHKPDDRERLMRTLTDGRAYETSIPWVIGLSGLNLSDPDVRQAVSLVRQIGTPSATPGARPVIDATPNRTTPDSPAGVRPAPKTGGPDGPGAVAASAKRKGPRDDPDGPSVAGLALMAQDTGRVLMLQRSVSDESDPARGTWEFPGGHIEDGDETSLHGAMREWSEEVGQPVPDGGAVLHTWTSPDGVYQGHVVVIPAEDALDLSAKRTVDNPDDDAEQCAWWDPEHARKNPALRHECKRTPWSALKRAAKTVRSPVTAAADPPRWRVDRKAGRRLVAIDRDLVTTIHAHAEASVGRAVEKAANRIRGRAQRDPDMAARFVDRDPRAVVADAGRDVAGDLTDDQLLAGAFDELEQVWHRELGRAARAAEAVVAQVLDGRPITAAGRGLGVAARIVERGRSAWSWLHGRLLDRARAVLYGEAEGDPVPVALINGAVAQAGGLPETSGGVADDGTVADGSSGGPGTGESVLSALRTSGALVIGTEWDYHPGIRRDTFPAHAKLHEQTFEGRTDPGLAVASGDEWIAGGFYHPQDHTGCRCGWAPIAIIPMTDSPDPGDPQVAALRAKHIGSGEGASA